MWGEQYAPHLTDEKIKVTELEGGEEIHSKKATNQIKEQSLVFRTINYQNIKVIVLSYLESLESREYNYYWIGNLSMC